MILSNHFLRNGIIYEGSFQNGLFSGQGKITYPNGMFKGEFYEGFKEGMGALQYKSGEKLEG